MSSTGSRTFVPAAGRDFFLPAYDPIMRLLRFSRDLERLIAQAAVQPGYSVLDLGCGTGTLAVLIRRRHPDIAVTAIDPDAKALAIAMRKAARAHVSIRFERAFGDELPFESASFDRVFSTMMFHHISRDEKPRVLAEIRRVLAPGGRLELMDFTGGRPPNRLARMIHGSGPAAAGDDRLVARMRDARFADARRVGERATILGAVGFYEASVSFQN
jgi:ubiquinone/menaquinone biosynthesis C-methylase UbiE